MDRNDIVIKISKLIAGLRTRWPDEPLRQANYILCEIESMIGPDNFELKHKLVHKSAEIAVLKKKIEELEARLKKEE